VLKEVKAETRLPLAVSAEPPKRRTRR
jgi:hypothetical protein